MAQEWNLERLRAMPVHDRAGLYRNACRLAHTPQGAALKKLLEAAGLPFSEAAALTLDDPISVRMHEVINSPEGRAAAIEATKAGLPAMAGIDPLLQVALGVDYGSHNQGTNTAGWLVGQLMQTLGYRKDGEKPLPAHCVAKTAAMWK
ncbi:hypothetical protein [Phenylobacterium sp.]|uniref:hypothetical protein n=1 Tax=Phenylobacterium sp. TaxID=1871053 RepID=UPI00356213C1